MMDDDLRSKSYRDGRMQIESYHGGGLGNGGGGMGPSPSSNGFHDLRCYSASYASSATQGPPVPKELKKGKSTNGSVSKALCFGDPELQRKKRVASYKVYTVEGKMKGSFRKSFRWLKDRYSHMVHGWW
ncbi:hypothetical protein Dimus_002713 [Dionaea muscipula]